jgi:hypothetical protein
VFPFYVGNVDPFDYIIERTLMRPRDVIAFINECLDQAQGTYEVTATMIRRAEAIFSTKRKHSIEQEWQSAYPSIKRLMTLLGSKKKSILQATDLCTKQEMDDMALAIYSETKVGYDPLFEIAKSCCDEGHTGALTKAIFSILYRVGAIGIKLQPGTRYRYSHFDHPLLPVAQIPDEDISIRIHPMLHATFGIQ